MIIEFTQREYEVIILLSKGYTNQSISNQLEIGISSIENYINHIFSKLDIFIHNYHKRTKSVLWYLEHQDKIVGKTQRNSIIFNIKD